MKKQSSVKCNAASITFKTTLDNKERLKTYAKEQNLNLSEYVNRCVVSTENNDVVKVDFRPPEIVEIIEEVNRLKKNYPKSSFANLERMVRQLWQS